MGATVWVSATSDYLKPISFLVVDDRAYMRRVIKGILETLGCKRIDEAKDGREALSVMKSWAPDIVITEWLLEPMSGLEMLKAVRADKSNAKFTPIIMITSETRREKVILARNAGVTEYVAKPFNAKSLILRIKEVVERPRRLLMLVFILDLIDADAAKLCPKWRTNAAKAGQGQIKKKIRKRPSLRRKSTNWWPVPKSKKIDLHAF